MLRFLPLFLLAGIARGIVLEKKNVLDGQLELLMPKGWRPMKDYLVKIKYPGSRPPTEVYSENSGALSLAFNLTESSANTATLPQYQQSLQLSMEKAFPNADWQETGHRKINGHQVYFFKVVTEMYDDRIYNQLFFTDFKGKLLICTFNCVENKAQTWKPIADSIMNSLRLIEN